jgi:hypothetical protein
MSSNFMLHQQVQILRLRQEFLSAVKRGEKQSTIRVGYRSIHPGLLVLESGNEVGKCDEDR